MSPSGEKDLECKLANVLPTKFKIIFKNYTTCTLKDTTEKETHFFLVLTTVRHELFICGKPEVPFK